MKSGQVMEDTTRDAHPDTEHSETMTNLEPVATATLDAEPTSVSPVLPSADVIMAPPLAASEGLAPPESVDETPPATVDQPPAPPTAPKPFEIDGKREFFDAE